MPTAKRLVRFFCCGCLLVGPAHAETVTIAVASNFTAAMDELIPLFERNSGHQVRAAFGSSGKFYAQIRHGAPFEVFFSADQSKPVALEKDGMAVLGSRTTYAVGALALWSAKSGVAVEGAAVLKHHEYQKLAMANPKLAPYGVAALQVLQRLDVDASSQSKRVYGENIAQTYQFVQTGNADVGLVALSQVRVGGASHGSLWTIPKDWYSPIRQDVVMLRQGEHNPAAKALLQFMQTSKARTIIQSYGYDLSNLSEKKEP